MTIKKICALLLIAPLAACSSPSAPSGPFGMCKLDAGDETDLYACTVNYTSPGAPWNGVQKVTIRTQAMSPADAAARIKAQWLAEHVTVALYTLVSVTGCKKEVFHDPPPLPTYPCDEGPPVPVPADAGAPNMACSAAEMSLAASAGGGITVNACGVCFVASCCGAYLAATDKPQATAELNCIAQTGVPCAGVQILPGASEFVACMNVNCGAPCAP